MKLSPHLVVWIAVLALWAGQPASAQSNDPVPLAPVSAAIAPGPVLAAMQRVADWQLAHPSVPPTAPPPAGCRRAGDAGFMALAGISGDAKYRDAMLALGETNDWKLGPPFV